MGAPVRQEGGADGKALPAVTAAIWALPSVNAPVPLQVGANSEGPAALPAPKRLLSCVNAPVPLQVRDPAKALPTGTARVGLAASSGWCWCCLLCSILWEALTGGGLRGAVTDVGAAVLS